MRKTKQEIKTTEKQRYFHPPEQLLSNQRRRCRPAYRTRTDVVLAPLVRRTPYAYASLFLFPKAVNAPCNASA